MQPIRIAAVALLVVLLSTSVATGNAVTAAERTVLSGEFVADALAEADAYATMRALVVAQVAPPANASEGSGDEREDGTGDPFADAAGRVVESSVSEAYVQREVEANLDRTYAYLHGEADELVIAVDVAPIRANLTAVVEAQITNESVAVLLASFGPESPTVTVEGAALDLRVVGEMAEGPAAYEAARTEFRSELRAGVVDGLVDEAFRASSDDERLALVIDGYDPDDYTADEKRAMVEEREPAIRSALRERIESEHGDEVDARIEERLAELGEVTGEDLAPQVNASADGLPPELVAPVADLAAAGVRALATDVPYETFVAETEEAKARLAANATAAMTAEMDGENGDQYVLAATTDPEAGAGLAEARRVVGIVDALAIALPVLSLALVGGLWWLTRSPAVTAGGAGVGLLLGGLPGYVLARFAGERLAEALAGGPVPPEASGLALALADRVLGVVAGQSLALVAVGAGLVALGGYLHVYGPPAWAPGGASSD